MTQPGPPKHVEPQTLWERLTLMKRPHKEIAFPRRLPSGDLLTEKIWIVVLFESELMASRKAAAVFAKTLLADASDLAVAGNPAYDETYRNVIAVEMLCRACGVVGQVVRLFFPDPATARR